ncbi:hypothetical protein Aau02nite_63450 [Amorphoplanes auranticolor]|uniref:Uncharacterized protein n=2 Tax=Actinoplanes auranticolor TaxID=47988 RepID=A0A919SNT1_9ACTN|nr:hypothetical protein Aau02nite_63450 [Actinoplanes auranticolor]
MSGVTANWLLNPLTIAWRDPEDYILSNTVNTYLQVQPLKPDLSQGTTGVELGNRADRSSQSTGPVTYSAYWLEWNVGSERFHAIPAAQAPYSNTPDGRNHVVMMLGRGDAGQWDLLYDYNTVATTALQAGGSTRFTRAGMAVRYPDAVTTAKPYQMRMQLMTLNQVWRRPYLGETGTGEPKTCEMPPRYEDWQYDAVNVPPRCFSVDVATVNGATETDPVQSDVFTVGKPAVGQTVLAPPVSTPEVTGRSARHNGVDQEALSACLAKGTENCMSVVPGLAECVTKRLVCRVLPPRSAGQAIRPSVMSSEQAIRAAQRALQPVGSGKTRVQTVDSSKIAPLDGASSARRVHVVTSTDRVRSLSASVEQTYDGYTAVYDEATSQLVYACLGACRD